MYIEIRKNAFYLKSSSWDKETKKTKNRSIYLGSDHETAKTALANLVTPDSPILRELDEAQENYAYNRAITVLNKLAGDLGDTKASQETAKFIEKLTKAQQKYADKSQKNSGVKSQFKSDILSHENLEQLEKDGQIVLCDNKSCKIGDDKSQINSDYKSLKINDIGVPKCPKCKIGFLQEKTNKKGGTFVGCSNYKTTGCNYTEPIKP